jgi:asparagine N-glycosylation enzyme membrane subunit Stt3
MKRCTLVLALHSLATLSLISFLIVRLTVWISYLVGIGLAFALTISYLRKRQFFREEARRIRIPIASPGLVVVPTLAELITLFSKSGTSPFFFLLSPSVNPLNITNRISRRGLKYFETTSIK